MSESFSGLGGGNRSARRRAGKQQPAPAAQPLAAALAHHRAGRLDRAETLYRQRLQIAPRDPDALHLLGVLAFDRGALDRAIGLIEAALAQRPRFAAAQASLGNALRAAGRLDAARASYDRAIALDPGLTLAHCNLALLLCDQQDFAAAAASCRRALALDDRLAEAHGNLGAALRGLGLLDEAEGALRRALALKPSLAGIESDLGSLLAVRDRTAEAIDCYRRAIALQPGLAAAHHGLAGALRRQGDMAGAVASYRRAVGLAPSLAVGWNDLGTALRALGRFDEAVASFRRALAVAPSFGDAYRNLVGCGARLSDQEQAAVAALAIRTELSAGDRIAAGFAAAKALEAAGRFDDAFAQYRAANQALRAEQAGQGRRFDEAALRARVDRLIARFTPERFAAGAGLGNPAPQPVFIVGMPRSGTSLVEQIVASHDAVFGAGELRDIGRIAVGLGGADDPDAWQADALRRAADAHLAQLGALGGGAARVTDKLPDNIFCLGLIAVLFPGARVIFCARDPRDVCLSCYFQRFAAGHEFATDLAECAARLRETERLAAHWRASLPLAMLTVGYEALVGDLASEARRLIEFLGLDWQPSCLAFHATDRVVATASSWQVRQPLYRDAVGRWRRFRSHIGELLAAFPD